MYKLVLFLFCLVSAQDYDEDADVQKIRAELELATLELQDNCENAAKMEKFSLITNSFSEKLKARGVFGDLVKFLATSLGQFEGQVPDDLLRNWTFFVQPGDGLLGDKDWNKLVVYDVTYDELVHTAKVNCRNANCVFIKPSYDNLLETSRNASLLTQIWAAWQSIAALKKQEFPQVLRLVEKAAILNGRDSARRYWEMLVDKDDAYELADNLWEQIKPLYFKLHNFVNKRLAYFYNASDFDQIPVFLLGSNFGYDWSPIAGLVSPQPSLYVKAESFLQKKKVQDLYKMAEDVTRLLKLGPLGPRFWDRSFFNMTFCENRLLSFCSDGHTEVFTCDKTTWTSYLDAFEAAFDVALRNLDYENLARSSLRSPVIDETVKNLGSFVAIKRLGTLKQESGGISELMLIALRFLPRLPYFLSADKWRLDLLENGFDSWERKWWTFRKRYQGVQAVHNNETDFLGDSFFTGNKPYLSKFFAVVLQFQILQYYQRQNYENPRGPVEEMASDESLMAMLRDRSATEWWSNVANWYSIYDLSADAILEFFAPLEQYLETAPLEQETAKPTTEAVEVHTVQINITDEAPLETLHHEHVEENMEAPNPKMANISMYLGLSLLAGVALLLLCFILRKRMKTNNRRFET